MRFISTRIHIISENNNAQNHNSLQPQKLRGGWDLILCNDFYTDDMNPSTHEAYISVYVQTDKIA